MTSNHDDAADLEIERLKAELASAEQVGRWYREENTKLKAELEEAWKECDYARPPIGSDVRTPEGEWLTVDQSKHVGKKLPDPGPPEWFRRLTEENRRLREGLELVLLFHSGQPWSVESGERWQAITGSNNATTKGMCDHIRSALSSGDSE